VAPATSVNHLNAGRIPGGGLIESSGPHAFVRSIDTATWIYIAQTLR
jgi:hypothetical protein